ncbi:hypothetical protein CQ018_01510 [Arthrobacter sp. MYb227]|uniref:Abi family protein n=1 Tax=Arthrobacter sp. MYb227 TaxID=1848601 RepID=UPI000CFAA6D2|nr:Abi family protein [Arthrobacter sp. MYb227]PQZ96462.1 hypothetical protein CQ018_01510 [Arthrobacter sp. MYb227]
MDMVDHDFAISTLPRVNYCRPSGNWYSFQKLSVSGRQDDFYQGTRFNDVVALYDFDARLRAATFAALMPVELVIRAWLGHELGRIDPCLHPRSFQAQTNHATRGPVHKAGQALPERTRSVS